MADTDRLTSERRLEPSASSDWVARFVLTLAAELDAASTRWMILRNHQDLPDRVGHDVDSIVHPGDAATVDPLLRALVRREASPCCGPTPASSTRPSMSPPATCAVVCCCTSISRPPSATAAG